MRSQWPVLGARIFRLPDCAREKDISISDAAMIALEINRAGKFFVTVKSAASDTGNFLIRNDSVAVLNDGNEATD
jgi:hypothetical protein